MEFWNYAENINEYNNGIIKYQSGIQSNEFDIEKLYENSLKDKGVILEFDIGRCQVTTRRNGEL